MQVEKLFPMPLNLLSYTSAEISFQISVLRIPTGSTCKTRRLVCLCCILFWFILGFISSQIQKSDSHRKWWGCFCFCLDPEWISPRKVGFSLCSRTLS